MCELLNLLGSPVKLILNLLNKKESWQLKQIQCMGPAFNVCIESRKGQGVILCGCSMVAEVLEVAPQLLERGGFHFEF
jgi:hypothetical protein